VVQTKKFLFQGNFWVGLGWAWLVWVGSDWVEFGLDWTWTPDMG
jgi:hypothetical protein